MCVFVFKLLLCWPLVCSQGFQMFVCLTSEDHPALFVTGLTHQQETHTDNNITKLEPALLALTGQG